VDLAITLVLAVAFTAALTAWSAVRWLYAPDEPPGLTAITHDLRVFKAALHVDAAVDAAVTALRQEAARWER